ncbi:SPOR domain-containing protein [Pseudohalioglobus sediminis]|uniref:SPOR domain-containing protein n=1 Tax=Pseudohalioglobus sediminis TaxID=2606449 RepID=UPI00165FA49E|nr:SPOR domain-containing protein [Pseudohalioglobus sediminis]
MALLTVTPAALAAGTLEDGYDAYERGDIAAAVGIWQELAIQGDATAQLNLGQLYRLGQGVKQSDEQAVEWYILAAQNGSEIAAVTLVQMEQDGRASKADVAKAFPDNQGTLANSLAVMAGGTAPVTPPEPEPEPEPVAARPAPRPAEPATVAVATPVQPAQPAPAAAPAPAKPAAAAPAPRVAVRPTTKASPAAPRQRITPLPRGQYVIQLLASASRDPLANYAGEKLSGSRERQHIVYTRRGTKKEYLLLLGPYPSQAAANSALGRQPQAVRQGMPWVGGQPWVRTTDSVMKIAHYATE